MAYKGELDYLAQPLYSHSVMFQETLLFVKSDLHFL